MMSQDLKWTMSTTSMILSSILVPVFRIRNRIHNYLYKFEFGSFRQKAKIKEYLDLNCSVTSGL
jgi:hypothetical protein